MTISSAYLLSETLVTNLWGEKLGEETEQCKYRRDRLGKSLEGAVFEDCPAITAFFRSR